MQKRHFSANSLVRVQRRHTLEKVDLQFVQGRRMFVHSDAAELREARFKVRQLQGIRPVVLVRSAKYFEDLEDLVHFRVASK